MRLFKGKQKDNIVRSTSVLVSSVGADEKLVAMADSDVSIYKKHYEEVTYTPVGDADSLVKIIKGGAFDLVHVFANVSSDGTIGRTRTDRVFRACAKKDVKLVFFAAENPVEPYSPRFKVGSLSLAWTIDRKGDNFPVFLDALLSKMSSGTTWMTAWCGLEPPVGAPPEDFIIMPTCILSSCPGGVVLLGKEQTVAWNPRGDTLLSQGAGVVSGFSVIMYGHAFHSPIFYREKDRRVNIGWEGSGNPRYGILIAGLDLREWHEPKGVKIEKEHQLEILRKLRQWLSDQNVKSDIDVPLEDEITDRRCHWANCDERKVRRSAYCQRHRDLNVLRE